MSYLLLRAATLRKKKKVFKMKLQEELDPESIETARKDTDALQQQYTADRKW